MVRLKVGTLYSVFFVVIVSIPYGAIKSLTPQQIVEKFTRFQFLMVRLKDETETWAVDNAIDVSIPYGAIKRLINLIF